MFDLHCHILPHMDDGSSSMEETRDMLKVAALEGIELIAATHHFFDDQTSIEGYLELWECRHKQIQPVLDELKIEVRIVTGAEVMISPFLAQLEGLHRLCINESSYLLIELPMMDLPQYTEEVIYNLCLKGLVPIIAHPERNRRIMEDPNLLYPFIELGAWSQVTSGSITGLFGDKVKRCAKILLNHNMAHLIGTDAHSSGRRAPRMKEAVHTLKKWTGREKADKIVNELPQAVLNNEFIEMDTPKLYKKSIFTFFS
jgi:protein-tyrosine phosphatase